MTDIKGKYTIKEICQQPLVLKETYQIIKDRRGEIKTYLNDVFEVDNVDIILTGAGSSAFVGETLEGLSNELNNKITRAIATTDILTNPELHLSRERRTLLISFARSGNSPESLAVIQLANDYCQEVFQLIITCNKNGDLATKVTGQNSFIILLPVNTYDKSLAMTSSFTSMLLAYILVVKIETIDSEESSINKLGKCIDTVLNKREKIKNIAQLNFKRAFFLGSGYMLGIARESNLKLQELTDGQVICKHDSFLGFRHGPRVVVDNKTLVVYLMSNNENANRYELDLINQINETQKLHSQVIICSNPLFLSGNSFDLEINYNESDIENEYLSIAHVVLSQLIGYYKSLELGLDPDNPSKSGKISRVVKGVSIYKWVT